MKINRKEINLRCQIFNKRQRALGMKVKLDVILDAIEMADDNYTYFLDLETGESVFLADELITGLNNEGLRR